MMPYVKCRVHGNWRWNYNTGGGQLMDWIGHHCDIAHWGLGFDNTGPSEVEVEHVEFPPPHAVWNTAPKYRVSAKYLTSVTGYPNDVQMTLAGTGPESYPDIKMGCKWTAQKAGFGWTGVISIPQIRVGKTRRIGCPRICVRPSSTSHQSLA
jgi:hypothetical protein